MPSPGGRAGGRAEGTILEYSRRAAGWAGGRAGATTEPNRRWFLATIAVSCLAGSERTAVNGSVYGHRAPVWVVSNSAQGCALGTAACARRQPRSAAQHVAAASGAAARTSLMAPRTACGELTTVRHASAMHKPECRMRGDATCAQTQRANAQRNMQRCSQRSRFTCHGTGPSPRCRVQMWRG
jgi:hypothetical protein